LLELALEFVARGQCGSPDPSALRGQAQVSAASVGGDGHSLDEPGALGLVGERAGRLLGHVEHLGQARDRRLLGGDGADHEPE